jgi:hypothetical protein
MCKYSEIKLNIGKENFQELFVPVLDEGDPSLTLGMTGRYGAFKEKKRRFYQKAKSLFYPPQCDSVSALCLSV